MSAARLRARLDKLAAACCPMECRCHPATDVTPGDCRAALRAKCLRCGGFYTLVIVEEIVTAGDSASIES